MKKTLALTLGLLGMSIVWAPAQSTVNYTAAPGQRDIWNVDGTAPLATGNYVSIGYFDAGFDIGSFNGDLMAIAAAWHEYGATTVQPIFGQPGRFAGNSSSMDPAFDNEQLYLWVMQTDDNGGPDGNYGNVIGYGIYTSSGDNWLFPTQGGVYPENTTSVNSSEVTTAYYGTFDANHLLLQPIPEPATLVMFLSAIPFYLWIRRRT